VILLAALRHALYQRLSSFPTVVARRRNGLLFIELGNYLLPRGGGMLNNRNDRRKRISRACYAARYFRVDTRWSNSIHYQLANMHCAFSVSERR